MHLQTNHASTEHLPRSLPSVSSAGSKGVCRVRWFLRRLGTFLAAVTMVIPLRFAPMSVEYAVWVARQQISGFIPVRRQVNKDAGSSWEKSAHLEKLSLQQARALIAPSPPRRVQLAPSCSKTRTRTRQEDYTSVVCARKHIAKLSAKISAIVKIKYNRQNKI